MDYSFLKQKTMKKKSRIGLIGATRGYGYTLLSQMTSVECLQLRAICARHTDDCIRVLKDLGYPSERYLICETAKELQEAPEDAVIITDDYRLAIESGVNSVVECTGNPSISADAVLLALQRKINVYMVSKETDSVCGAFFNRIAEENNAVYALVNGDQPRNLLDLYSWVQLCGLEIVAIGKSSEYDFVWDYESEVFTCYDEFKCRQKKISELQSCWRYKGIETLKHREAILKEYISVSPADICEMNIVSNLTGFAPATPAMHYPIAKISELADIFIPKEDGGILDRSSVIDVFFNLRAPDEASFAGGVFAIVKCNNEEVWDILGKKGHVVSRNKKYACIYYPYHLMGVETPASIILGDFMGIGTHSECRQVSVMIGVAKTALSRGSRFKVDGHSHIINGLTPELRPLDDAKELVPFYLLDDRELLRDVKPGEAITMDMVDLSELHIYEIYRQGLEIETDSVIRHQYYGKVPQSEPRKA